ncbi:MAG: N-acetylmuramoyl-L-alanine amidase [Clostridia bacterium]|nr:N-acetylmuramoyl-L-alanine amidase [Clostridia bacterium]
MKNKILISVIIVLSLVLTALLLFFSFKIVNGYTKINGIFSKSINISNEKAFVTKYAIYGTHLNIEGSFNIANNENSSFKLVMINENSDEINIPIFTNIQKNLLEFYTSKTINQGIYLEGLQNSNFLFYLKETDNVSGLSKYHGLVNKSKFGDLEYYTITKHNSNSKIDIGFNNNTLYLNSKKSILPDNYYDIVIDQGHGGKSTGAISHGYTESLITYEYGIKLKESLEKLGLKVLITRDDINETVGDYNENGRAVIPNLVKAKYCLSIHINSSPINSKASGVEIYCPNHADITFGKALADNIIEIAGTNTSPNNVGRYSRWSLCSDF